MKYELSEQVINNLVAFLQRVDLKGHEAFAYCEIIQVLNSPIQEEIK